MQEIVAVAVSFFTIPILSKKKVPIGIAICICSMVMALIGGLDLLSIKDILKETFLNFNKVRQYIVIAELGILGVLLRDYRIIDNVIKYLYRTISNKRVILMSIPAIIGLLSVPGGAIISAPFIDRLGEEANLPKTQRAIINLVYRHVPMHVMPYSSGFLIVASLAPRISLYKLAGVNLIFVMLYVVIGYFLYILPIKDIAPTSGRISLSNLFNLLKYTSPVYSAVLLNIFFGLPFYLGLLANLLIVYLLSPKNTFLIDITRAFNFKILSALVGVYLIQGVIGEMELLSTYLTAIFADPKAIVFGIVLISFFFGMTTGYQPTALGMIMPILAALPLSDMQLLFYCHFTFEWSFIGYFFSPLHLCQLFTCEHLGVSTLELYKEYWKLFLSLVAVLIINYFLLGIWMS